MSKKATFIIVFPLVAASLGTLTIVAGFQTGIFTGQAMASTQNEAASWWIYGLLFLGWDLLFAFVLLHVWKWVPRFVLPATPYYVAVGLSLLAGKWDDFATLLLVGLLQGACACFVWYMLLGRAGREST